MLRVHGLPATLTAFITSMAVLFQSAMTSARTCVLPEIRARPTIAAFSTFIVASFFEKSDFSNDCQNCAPLALVSKMPYVVERGYSERFFELSADWTQIGT